MQANPIGLPHLEHGRIPISARLYRWIWLDRCHDASLLWAGALPISLSPITALFGGGDGATVAPNTNAGLVNIDHYRKFRSARTAPVWGNTEAVYAGLSPMNADTCGDETSMHLEGPH